jgi:hypothetical protein
VPPFPDGLTASEAEFVADLSAVQADDALLDALGGSDPKIADGLGDLELNAHLLAWRRDIDSEPLADLVDTDTAMTIVKTAALAKRNGHRGHGRRLLVPVAAAAAVLAIAFTGTGLAARDAHPGDTLWSLTKVLYADHARSVEAAAAARVDLETANIALAGGRLEDARKALNDAQAALKQVSVEDNLSQLMAQHRQLSAQLVTPDMTPSPPAPPSSLPSQTTTQQLPPVTSATSRPPAGTGGTTTSTPPPRTTSPPQPPPPPPESTESTPPSSTTPSNTTNSPASGPADKPEGNLSTGSSGSTSSGAGGTDFSSPGASGNTASSGGTGVSTSAGGESPTVGSSSS